MITIINNKFIGCSSSTVSHFKIDFSSELEVFISVKNYEIVFIMFINLKLNIYLFLTFVNLTLIFASHSTVFMMAAMASVEKSLEENLTMMREIPLKRRILVTGGAGFIATHTIICLLDAGFDVTVVDNLINSSEEGTLLLNS